MDDYELVSPRTTSEWASYHAIRRKVLFEARGLAGVYDENHPDETAPGNHPLLLLYRSDPVGVVRLDIANKVAALRRVAIRADVQRRGHGRVLLQFAERFAQAAGCSRLVSFVAPDALTFYQRAGFIVLQERATGPSGRESILMAKDVVASPAGDDSHPRFV